MIRSFLSHAFTAWLQAKELYCNSLPPIGEADHAWRQAAARSAAVRALLGSLFKRIRIRILFLFIAVPAKSRYNRSRQAACNLAAYDFIFPA